MGASTGAAKRFGRWIGRWWSPLLGGVVVALWGASGLTPDGHYDFVGVEDVGTAPSLLVAAVGVSIVGSIGAARQLRDLREVAGRATAAAERASTAEYALMAEVRAHLEGLMSLLELYSDARASIFLTRDETFLLIGRYSRNPALRRTSGRPVYPMGQGVITQAWLDGKAEDPELPDPGPRNAPTPTRGWLNHQLKRHQVPEDVALRFTMRSRSYAAIRLDDREQSLDRALGVLVVETERPADKSMPSAAANNALGASLAALEALSVSTEVQSLTRLMGHLQHLDAGTVQLHLERLFEF